LAALKYFGEAIDIISKLNFPASLALFRQQQQQQQHAAAAAASAGAVPPASQSGAAQQGEGGSAGAASAGPGAGAPEPQYRGVAKVCGWCVRGSPAADVLVG
jgi:hypothetical protein